MVQKRWNAIRAVVFDLDGTLYPGYVTLSHYLRYLLSSTGYEDRIEDLWGRTRTILDGGDHEIRLGSFVRGEPGTDTLEVREVEVAYETTANAEVDATWTYLGDAWTVVYYLTRPLTIERDTYIDAFHSSRYAMSEGRLDHVPSARLRDALERLRSAGIYLVMQTNSSESSGRPTLEFLGLDTVFDEYIYSAGKPDGMEHLLRRLESEQEIHPHEVLSIGDHLWNDIVAARKHGAHSLLISPFPGLKTDRSIPRVHTEDEMIAILLNIADR